MPVFEFHSHIFGHRTHRAHYNMFLMCVLRLPFFSALFNEDIFTQICWFFWNIVYSELGQSFLDQLFSGFCITERPGLQCLCFRVEFITARERVSARVRARQRERGSLAFTSPPFFYNLAHIQTTSRKNDMGYLIQQPLLSSP